MTPLHSVLVHSATRVNVLKVPLPKHSSCVSAFWIATMSSGVSGSHDDDERGEGERDSG